METTEHARSHVLNYNPAAALTDKRMLWQSLGVITLVVLGFIIGHPLGYETGTIALSGAALLLLLDCAGQENAEQTKRVHAAFHEVEWETIFFFIGLFIIVAGVEHSGVLKWLADHIVAATQGDVTRAGGLIFWLSTFFSAFVNNIPFVATLIPVIKGMAPTMGGAGATEPLWWMLALGSCLGGNGTLIGASANVVVAGFAARAGQPIRFMPFMALAMPLMLLSVAIVYAYCLLVMF